MNIQITKLILEQSSIIGKSKPASDTINKELEENEIEKMKG